MAKIIQKSYDEIKFDESLAIAIGNFDGVHLAHQEIIKNAISFAKRSSIKSAVLMFSPNPKQYFDKNQYVSIHIFSDNLKKLEDTGIDYIIIISFDSKFMKLNPLEFIEFLSENLNAKFVTTGCNFRFGNQRKGDCEMLAKNAKAFKYQYLMVSNIIVQHEIASSSNIKRLIEMRCLKRAASLLGHLPYIPIKNQSQLIELDGFYEMKLTPIPCIVKPRAGLYAAFVSKEIHVLLSIDENGKLLLRFKKPFNIAVNRVYLHDFIRPYRIFRQKSKLLYQNEIDMKALRYLELEFTL